MTDSAGSVRLVQTSIGDYRQAFLEAIVERMGERFQAYAGETYFNGTTRTQVHLDGHLHPLRNRFLLHRRLLWQSGAVSAAVGAHVAVLEYNPRILSVWVALVMRRFLRRRTVLWGHAWSRSGRGSLRNVVRGAMRGLSDGLVVYSRTQGRELTGARPRRPLFVAPNAIYRRSQLEPADHADPRDFLYVGRLVTQKRPEVLLQAFSLALDRLPVGSRLVFVGEGPMEGPLRKAAASLPAGRVVLEGHVADPEVLRGLYARSIASVSPGYVGLSITQSLGFGVPMVVARDEPHSPEIEAAIEGFNCRFFAPTTAEALAKVMIAMAEDAPTWVARRAAIAEDCRTKYSVEAMADGFISAIEDI